MTLESYIAFCAAAAALALVPGPTVTVIVANSLRYGAKASMMNVAGTRKQAFSYGSPSPRWASVPPSR